MPPGSKKRKAAKRKKEQQAGSSNNTTSIHSRDPQGNDDPKSQDERDSDCGEVSSHVAQEHNKDQHHFGRGNEETDKAVSSFVQSAFPENIGVTGKAGEGKEVGPENDDMVQSKRELSSKQDSDNNIVIEHVEPTKESHGGDERSSSSSSTTSDEDSEAVKKKWNEEARSVDSLFEQVTQISENGKPLEDDSVRKISPDVLLDEPAVPFSEVKHVAESCQVENPEAPKAVESELKEIQVKLPASNEATDTSTAIIAPEKDEDKALPVLHEKSSDVVGFTTCVIDDKTFTASDAHPSEALNNETNIKYSETSESTENRPLIASTPRVSQRTSWMSCCGLFDVFTGSDR